MTFILGVILGFTLAVVMALGSFIAFAWSK